MMITASELVQTVSLLEADALQRWIESGWVLPAGGDDGQRFDSADVARVRLICDLHYELQIEEDSLSVVLSLLDQLYTTRRALQMLMAAVQAQPQDVRNRITALISTTEPQPGSAQQQTP
jgi:chaperone modulatory protein CbpM